MKRLYSKKSLLLLASICIIGGGFLGWYIRIYYTNQLPSKVVELRENDTSYHYINPLLLVDSPRQAPEYNDLQDSLAHFVASEKSKGDAASISIYFRDLNLGKWTGVDEDALYDPSSMLKVAVMIGYLRTAETEPSILSKKLPYTAHNDPGQHYKPDHPLTTGTYTVRELIEAMILDSDNNALASLYNNDRTGFVEVLKDLSIAPPPSIDTTDFMSPKTYAEILRTLFSSTYLARAVSEQVLQLLSYTNFEKGLVAGLPAKTIVAHKFGEHTNLVNNVPQSRQLHDCGIIYYPAHPYLLCVMTRGQDFSKLESIISSISKITYTYVADRNKI